MPNSQYVVTATLKAKMYVSYNCEKCEKQNTYCEEISISGKGASGDTWQFETQYKAEATHRALAAANDDLQKEIDRRQSSRDYGFKKCPNCSYIQSWMLRSAKKSRNENATIYLWGFILVALLITEFLFHPLGLNLRYHNVVYLVYIILGLPFISLLVARSIGKMLYSWLIPFNPNESIGISSAINSPEVHLQYNDRIIPFAINNPGK